MWCQKIGTELQEGSCSLKASVFPSVNSNGAASSLTGPLGG